MIALYIVLGIVALILLIAAVLPGTGIVRRSIVVGKPVDQVFAYLSDYQNYLKWNPWSKMEPQAQNTLSSPSVGVGASWEWNGKKVGHGKLTTQSLTPPTAIRSRLEFFKPFKGVAQDTWDFETVDGGTRITWGFVGKNAYPINRLFWMLMIKSQLTQQFDSGLAEIKRQMEG